MPMRPLLLIMLIAVPGVAVDAPTPALPPAGEPGMPAPAPTPTLSDPQPVTPSAAEVDASANARAALTLGDALRLAFTQGRDRRTQDEELRLLEATLGKVRGDYLPQPRGTVSVDLAGTGNAPPTDVQRADLGVSQALPTGGSADIATTTVRTGASAGGDARATAASASIVQPLLRGAGSLRWRESLTVAERSLLYGLRSHHQFLQELTVGISRTYWSLQGQQSAVAQARAAVERAVFIFEQSQALMSIGKTDANDVFRAEVSLLGARQSQLDAEAGFSAALDGFKLDLGLPVATPIAIEQELTAGPPLVVDAQRAIAAALERRLDWLTVQDRVADARRSLALARRDLLPSLDLRARIAYGGAAAAPWSDTFTGQPEWNVGAALEIPFDRRDEDLSYQRALVSLARSSRDLEESRGRVVREVLDAIRRLRSAVTSLNIQDRNRLQAGRRSEKAYLDFRAGLIGNRDLVEAQDDVRDAENNWFDALVAYRSAELRLRRDTGTLVVREDGSWDETLPDYATIGQGQP